MEAKWCGGITDVPLALARVRHAEARKLLAISIDPMAKRKSAKTVEEAVAKNFFLTIAGLGFELFSRAESVDGTA